MWQGTFVGCVRIKCVYADNAVVAEQLLITSFLRIVATQ